MPTLSEVARRAGVTPATVSNVLRNRGRVGANTRQRVLEAVEALGYRPHLAARALAEGRAPTLALMVSSIANPFYPEFALAVEHAARSSGHFVI
ncbi:MAG: LacI family DNA-binding transcriptional regulator, partial [Paraburkholderia fungorum]|nr:LacI family DNA-binding transcriptional regulator [Paraburkholderia fungorum]